MRSLCCVIAREGCAVVAGMRLYGIGVFAVVTALTALGPFSGHKALAAAGAGAGAGAGHGAGAPSAFKPLPLVPLAKRDVARPADYVKITVHRLAARPGSSAHRAAAPATPPSPPFGECPALGADTSCGILVQVTDSANNIIGDPSQGPYDGSDDTLIGVLNSSSDSIGSLTLSSDTDLFNFDQDGLCTASGAPAGCPFGPTGYEGPGTSFSAITPDTSGGVVNFSPPVAPGATAYFSLEEPLSATMVTAGGPSAGEQGGPVNLSENPTTCSIARPVNCATGVFWHQFTDLSVPGRGVALNFSRTYSSSAAATDGPLGFGWTDSYNMSLATDASGDAIITQEDGSVITFQPNGSGGFTAPPRVLATLAENADGSFTLVRDKSQVQYNFSATGQLTSEVDLNGYQADLAYNGNGQLTTVTDSEGRTLTFTYSGSHIATVKDPMGRVWTYAYDGSGNLVSAADPMNRTWSFSYDSGHQLLTITDPRGGVTVNVYNGSGQVTSQTDPAGRTTSWSYTGSPANSAGGTTTVTDPAGNVTSYQYANLELMSVTRAFGTSLAATTSYTYDPATLGVTSVTDPAGNLTTSSYDSSGNLISTTDPLGNTTTYDYDSFNQVAAKISPLGETTSYSYDATGNLLSVTDPLGNTTTYDYSDASHPGDVTSITNPDGNVVSYGYDSFGDVASVSVSPSAGVTDTTEYVYDNDGERTCAASPDATANSITCPAAGGPVVAGTTATSYDADGEVTSVTNPDGDVTSYNFDADGNRTAVTDAAGHVSSFTYNADNQRTKVSRPDGSTVLSGYDSDGNLVTQTDAAGYVTTYAYDALGEVTSVTGPLGQTTSYGYDLAGNRATLTDPSGRVTSYSYDAGGELTGVSYSDGSTPDVSYSYDADGQRATMSDGTGVTGYSYDADGHLVGLTNGAGASVSYAFDPAGQLTSLTYPNNKTVTRAYNSAGELVSVQDWLGNTTSFGYDADGNLVTESYPNGVAATSAFDRADRLMTITDKHAGSTLASFSYTRNSLGQVTSETDTGAIAGSQSYSYTSLSQLASSSSGSYGYDSTGDLTSQPGAVTESYNAGGQLTSLTEPATVRAPGTDQVVSANETTKGSKITSGAVTTKSAGELILAFVSAAGPAKGSQSVTGVTGGGLTWKLAVRSDGKQGTAEVWQARASAVLTAVKITATLKDKGFNGAITIATFTGAGTAAGAHAAASGATGAPAVSLKTTGPDSLVWAAGEDPSHATARKAAAGQSVVHQLLDTGGKSTEWTQKVSAAIAAAGSTVKVSDTAPTADKWDMAAVEITAAPAAGNQTISYGYDKEGNRTSVSPSGQAPVALGYDQANRLTSFGTSASYAYNGDGLRGSKKVGSVSTAFTWDQSGALPLLIAAGATWYIYGPDGQPVEQITSGTPVYLQDDQQGSTRLLTDAAGAITGTYSYGPYGEVASHAGAASTALQYDGQYSDAESGYLYLQARYYDPAAGQFLSADPAVALTAAPYGYGADNPLNADDPLGLFSLNPFSWSSTTWTAIGIGAGLAALCAATACVGDLVIGAEVTTVSLVSVETDTLAVTALSVDTYSAAVSISIGDTLATAADAVGNFALFGGTARATWDTLSACYNGGDCAGNLAGLGLTIATAGLLDGLNLEGAGKAIGDILAGGADLAYDYFKEHVLEAEHDQATLTC